VRLCCIIYLMKHAEVSRLFPSWNQSMLTEIHLWHACSCQEILRTETAGQAGAGGGASRGDQKGQCVMHTPISEFNAALAAVSVTPLN
jgi:hypothetical protein